MFKILYVSVLCTRSKKVKLRSTISLTIPCWTKFIAFKICVNEADQLLCSLLCQSVVLCTSSQASTFDNSFENIPETEKKGKRVEMEEKQHKKSFP